jgi:hypothetical protein
MAIYISWKILLHLQILATDLWRFFEFDSTTARGGCFHLPQVSKLVSKFSSALSIRITPRKELFPMLGSYSKKEPPRPHGYQGALGGGLITVVLTNVKDPVLWYITMVLNYSGEEKSSSQPKNPPVHARIFNWTRRFSYFKIILKIN